jgi:hypothetical protein
MHKNKIANSVAKIGSYFSAIYLAQSGINSPTFQNLGPAFGAGSGSPAGANTLGSLALLVVQILLIVVGTVATVWLIIGGYRYVIAHGNEEQTEAAKKTITGAIIGLVVVLLSFAIVQIISSVLLQGTGGLGL